MRPAHRAQVSGRWASLVTVDAGGSLQRRGDRIALDVRSSVWCQRAARSRGTNDPGIVASWSAELEGRGAAEVFVGWAECTMDGAWDGESVGLANPWIPTGGPFPKVGGRSRTWRSSVPGDLLRLSLVGLVDVRNPLTGPGARAFCSAERSEQEVEERLSHGLDRLGKSPRKKAGTLPGTRAGAAVAWGLDPRASGKGSLVGGCGVDARAG